MGGREKVGGKERGGRKGEGGREGGRELVMSKRSWFNLIDWAPQII